MNQFSRGLAVGGRAGSFLIVDSVGVLAQLRSAQGYMAEFEMQADGSFLLIENHCPICAAANACQGSCRSELELFQAAFGADTAVTRQEHLLSEGRRCVYRIERARRRCRPSGRSRPRSQVCAAAVTRCFGSLWAPSWLAPTRVTKGIRVLLLRIDKCRQWPLTWACSRSRVRFRR
jgi:hypothetical protein